MKFIVAILLHAFLAFAVGLYSQFPWWLFVGTSGIVAVAQILPLGGSYIALIILTGVVGGLLGGFAALTGAFIRSKSTK